MVEKEITLDYNDYEIKINIKNDYNETMETIKKKLYFSDKDLEKSSLYYYDEDDDENDIDDEDQFEEAYKSSHWGLRKQEEEEPTPDPIDITEIKAKIQTNAQNVINEKIKEIKNELIAKFTKIANKAIFSTIKKYEEKIKELEGTIKSLKEKNKKTIEEMEKSNAESVKKVLKSVSEYSKDEINKYMVEYNNELSKVMESHMDNINSKVKTINEEAKNKLKDLNKVQEDMRSSILDSKDKFSSIYRMSMKIK